MTDPKNMPELLPCPFCGITPAFGLTKKTGCQMHGDPIQYVTLGCKNSNCRVKPMVTGGDRYARGERPENLQKGEMEAREEAIKYWNTRSTPSPQREQAGDVARSWDEILAMLSFHNIKFDYNEVEIVDAHIRANLPPDNEIFTLIRTAQEITKLWEKIPDYEADTPLYMRFNRLFVQMAASVGALKVRKLCR